MFTYFCCVRIYCILPALVHSRQFRNFSQFLQSAFFIVNQKVDVIYVSPKSFLFLLQLHMLHILAAYSARFLTVLLSVCYVIAMMTVMVLVEAGNVTSVRITIDIVCFTYFFTQVVKYSKILRKNKMFSRTGQSIQHVTFQYPNYVLFIW